MKLFEAIEAYVSLRRTFNHLGFLTDQRILISFGRAVGDRPIAEVTSQDCDDFCRSKYAGIAVPNRKHQTLRGFFNYLIARAHLATSPLRLPSRGVRSTFRPYVFSREEIRKVLDGTATLYRRRRQVTPKALRTLLLTLYAVGLRAGEALRLRISDVDLKRRILTVWNSKFHKSRLCPIGGSLASALSKHLKERQSFPMPNGNDSAFFGTSKGKAINLQWLEDALRQLREKAGILGFGERRHIRFPRLHDFRHAFAVHRLVAWYREGLDVQSRLAWLSTYLGHTSVEGTQTYLTMTHDLLSEASARFERYACPKKEISDE
jgi:site-specific recombinase XerD